MRISHLESSEESIFIIVAQRFERQGTRLASLRERRATGIEADADKSQLFGISTLELIGLAKTLHGL